jgi:hypothetical protein
VLLNESLPQRKTADPFPTLSPAGRFWPDILCAKDPGMSKFAVFLPLLLLAACGGSAPPAEAPKEADSAEAAPKEKPADDSKAAGDTAEAKPDAEADAKSDKKAEAKPDDSMKTKRSAQDILTAPDVVFMVSFADSDVKQAADSKCTASSGNDPKKMNQCMAKARKSLDVDGYRLKQKDGQWWFFTLRTKGKTVLTLHKYAIDFGPEKEGSVTIKPKGKDMGSAAGRLPAPFTIDVPNEYQIVLTDPKLGKLVYEAKIGVASD